ncbi:MAG TPA: glycine--tRNA ligase subunit beta, partial [Candidatus Eremiobacteraceae bacterium]|nr:glycine--tRNA ligase subunit beta [Candidatus Eremiobacteraceae bacterium]
MKSSGKKSEDRRAELLVEIGCEEIPAGMLPRAEEELRSGVEKLLAAENMADGVTIEAFSAPRRLTAWVRGLKTKQADIVSEITGPPKSVAYDAVGAPTRAAVSFAEKQGVALHDLYLVQTAKGDYIAAKQIKRGRSTEQILLDILPRIIHDIYWPKTMTWTGLAGARFIRPVRWLVGIFDGKPLKFQFASLAGGAETCGHRFLGASKIRVKDFEDYEKKLRANGVIVRASARREKVEKELSVLAKKGGYKV